MNKFSGFLDLRERDDGTWELISELCFTSDLIGRVCVPKGFVTDLASVPRLPFMFWWYGDRARKPAVIHDFLYTGRHVDRATADAVFEEAMESLQIAPWVRGPMWAAVRLFGWAAY